MNFNNIISNKKNTNIKLLSNNNYNQFDDENIVFSFAGVSDMHNSQVNFKSALDVLSNASKRKLDAVISAGDLTDNVVYGNSTAEIPQVKSFFEKNILPNYRLFFCLGNHDSNNSNNAKLFYNGLGSKVYEYDTDKETAKNYGNRHTVINGYHFIALECGYEKSGKAYYSDITINWFKKVMQEIVNAPEYKGESIFILSHAPIYNTVTKSDCGSSQLDSFLVNYPQVIFISGHSHETVYDEYSIMQKDFTSIQLGAVQFMNMENEYIETIPPWLLPESYSLAFGMLFEIDSTGNIKVTRYNLLTGDKIKNEWIIPSPKQDKSHLKVYTTDREINNKAPEFRSNDISIKSYSEKEVKIKFSTAYDDDFVYYYKVNFYNNNRIIKSIKTLSKFWKYPDCVFPENHEIIIDKSGLIYPLKLEIIPVDKFGKEGGAITKEINGIDLDDFDSVEKIKDEISNIGTVNLKSYDNIINLRKSYNDLSYFAKKQITNIDTFISAEKELYNNYLITENEKNNEINSDILVNYAPTQDRCKIVKAENYGAKIEWIKATTNYSVMVDKEYNFNKLHISFSNLVFNSEEKDFGIIISNVRGDKYTNNESLLIHFNFNTGEIYFGNKFVGEADIIKYDNLLFSPFDLIISNSLGTYNVKIKTLFGEKTIHIYNNQIAEIENLQDLTRCYVSVTPYAKSVSGSVDLISVYDIEEVEDNSSNNENKKKGCNSTNKSSILFNSILILLSSLFIYKLKKGESNEKKF